MRSANGWWLIWSTDVAGMNIIDPLFFHLPFSTRRTAAVGSASLMTLMAAKQAPKPRKCEETTTDCIGLVLQKPATFSPERICTSSRRKRSSARSLPSTMVHVLATYVRRFVRTFRRGTNAFGGDAHSPSQQISVHSMGKEDGWECDNTGT